ncbi:hypothetical protein HN587_03130 [Candidatus Woesearchaeota archaeon]|jgi:hypothetical protein|nr:hypothetical protein [Candidatus Woesearchaeota archaeon]
MPKEKYSHTNYFMNSRLHDVLDRGVQTQSPLDVLTQDEWLTVIHHLNAHEVEGARTKGYLMELLDGNSDRFFLYQTAVDYVSENNGGQLIPESEKAIFGKACELVARVDDEYKWAPINQGDEFVGWDIVPKE